MVPLHPCKDPVIRPVSWEHLTVTSLGPAPFKEQAPRQEGSSQHTEGNNTPEGAWAVSHTLAV